MAFEPTTAEHLPVTAGEPAGEEVEDRRLWEWVVRYAPADRPTQRALYRACHDALKEVRVDAREPDGGRLIPRVVERTLDRYLARLLGTAEPRSRRERAKIKVLAMTQRRAPVYRPAPIQSVTPLSMAGPNPRNSPIAANTDTVASRRRIPAPLLPPEAPLDMPEQDLS
ncbi:hypothetical protein [Rhodovibrio salinarum]|uniref:hypothetical protein n=1 Tax=Rhodovibrio salinarum TaxID=1087 RepID=UPI0004B08CAB|nr:hypothetical protein [Rhodovibrio salinarum]